MKQTVIYLMLLTFIVSCSSTHKYIEGEKGTTSVAIGYKSSDKNNNVSVIQPVSLPETKGGNQKMIPNATAFRMSGDYSKNVAISLLPDGSLGYFPAPTDITADSEPISLGNGWWLNCQGIGPNSVFTKYTFPEYSSLLEAPSPEQLKSSIIPGAKVTDFIELPMTQTEALGNMGEIKQYLKDR